MKLTALQFVDVSKSLLLNSSFYYLTCTQIYMYPSKEKACFEEAGEEAAGSDT